MEAINADICIVGSGVAGLAIARRLSSAGLRVLLVESGSRTDSPLGRDLSRGENIGMPYWALDYSRTRRFGGCAAMWFLDLMDGSKGLRVRPLDRIDFEVRPEVPNSGWPISYDDLVPYFKKAEELFQVCEGEDWDPVPDASHFGAETPEIRTVNFRFSPGSLFTDTYYDELQRAGTEILLETTVLKLNFSHDGSRVMSIEVRKPDGSLGVIKSARTILACGGIENPRLLLLSTVLSERPVGTGTENIGRYFMEHPHFLSGTITPGNAEWLEEDNRYVKHSWNGASQISKIALSETLIRKHGLLNFCVHLSRSNSTSGHRLQRTLAYDSIRILRSHAVGRSKPAEFGRYASAIVRGLPELIAELGLQAIRGFADGPRPTHFDLYHMSEQIPNHESRVTLGTSKDAFDQPRARLEWRITEDDIQRVIDGQKLIEDGLLKSGAGRFDRVDYRKLPPPGIRGGYHHMGTTRMSDSAASGVVDKNCKVHGVENLFVAGSSVFPTCGFANPTFTIGALSLRLADHLLTDH